MKKVAFIFGTRPEAIKLAPIILAMRAEGSLQAQVRVTAQHRQMLDQVLCVFDIVPDVDLDLMRPNQTLAELTSRAITAVDGYLAEHRPDMILVQGDTTTVFCAGLCGFYRRVPVGYVEALESEAVQLAGTDATRIVEGASALLEDPTRCRRDGGSPYGGGQAAGRILTICQDLFGGRT
jgi:UDP-N-acetylglucosamine 2-epimerase